MHGRQAAEAKLMPSMSGRGEKRRASPLSGTNRTRNEGAMDGGRRLMTMIMMSIRLWSDSCRRTGRQAGSASNELSAIILNLIIQCQCGKKPINYRPAQRFRTGVDGTEEAVASVVAKDGGGV